MITMLTIVFLSLLTCGMALVAYDCGGDYISMVDISTITKPTCVEHKPNISTETVRIALSQSSVQYEVPFIRCSIQTINSLGRCGKSIDTFSDAGIYTELIQVTRDECNTMIKHKVYRARVESGDIDIELTGGDTRVSHTTRGSFDSSESCTPGTKFHHGGKTYNRPVVSTAYIINFSTGTALVDVEKDSVKFPNGLSCPYSDENCFSADYGNVFWTKPRPKCNDKEEKSLIYSGAATLVSVNSSTSKGQRFIQVTHGGYDFQILLSERTEFICGFRSFLTEHPNLYITILGPDSPNLELDREVGPLDVNLLNYINSKIVYSLRHTKQQVEKLFEVFQRNRCESYRMIIDNMLTLSVNSPTQFAFMYGGPGHTAVTIGETTYLAQCPPVVVEVDTEARGCYNELPVIYNNSLQFMSPRSHILVSVGKHVPCLPNMMPKFLLGDTWVVRTEHGLMKTTTPSVITPDPVEYSFEMMNGISSGGLYTTDLIKRYQKALVSPIVENIISTRISESLSGSSGLPEGYNFASGFKPSDFSIIRNEVGGFWSNFRVWAPTTGGWLGFFLICFNIWKLFSSLVSSIVSFRALNKEVNCLLAFLMCLFEAVTSLFFHNKIFENKRKIKNEKGNAIKSDEDVELGMILV